MPTVTSVGPARAADGLPLTTRMRRLWLSAAALLYTLLGAHQLNLPGLHYDEAKEAGVNAVELLTGAPVSAFRDVALTIGDIRLPLMVQDYIGALNIYLALPFLAVTGIGVPNLRALPLLTGLLALLTLERAVSAWVALDPAGYGDSRHDRAAISLAGLLTVTLLAVSPSFLFWSRQGIFVTNLTQPLTFAMIWQGLHWLRTGRPGALRLSALAAGFALYAKLLAFWVVVPFGIMLLIAWWRRHRAGVATPTLTWTLASQAALGAILPLTPLLLFNMQSGGTLTTIGGNLGQSYYGVDNSAMLDNLAVRLRQTVTVLRGDQFWYLGATYANRWAPPLAAAGIFIGLVRRPRQMIPPLGLAAMAIGASVFTVSDLFVTHYALLQPLFVGTAALGYASCFPGPPRPARARILGVVGASLLVLWIALDAVVTLRYHASLARSGGLADHADTSYHVAYYLRYNGLGAPLALDWGFDAPVRYLSAGSVRPIELFGYASPAAPDPAFASRLAPFLENPDNVYLLHAPDFTTFAGRREAFFAAAEAMGHTPALEQSFAHRDGTPLVEIWRVR